jgi:hypothetical protein
MPTCPTCSAEGIGDYCSSCGERRVRPDDLSATAFVHEIADQVASFRFKFKTLHTLRALVRPGLLTTEFLAGRRRPYLTPLRLYLVCAALFFLAAPWAGFTLEEMIQHDPSGSLSSLASTQMADRGLDRAHFTERFDLRIQSVYTIAVGAGVIASALLLQLMSWRSHIPLGAHLVFALHFVSFEYLVTVAIGITRRLGVSNEAASAIGLCLLAVYLVLALKRVYSDTATAVLLKAVALFALMLAINYAASAAAIRLTLRMV